MTDALSGSSTVWNSEIGEFINEDHARMHQMLQEYAPGRYELLYIPKVARETPEDHARPWAILEHQGDGRDEIVRTFSEVEASDPAAILAWVFNGDLTKHSPRDVLARIEMEEDVRIALKAARNRDLAEDRMQYAAFLASGGREKKHTIRLGGGRVLARG